MAYAQIHYSQTQGINGRYTISQIGCFITAFCNLADRLGEGGTDPAALNSFLTTNNYYIDVDDGIRDDVGWTTISEWKPDITVAAVGSGAPTSNDSIVKFAYNSYQTGNPTTHFCLVQDASAGTIVDSWDGQVKSWNVYGGPKEWASYVKSEGDNMTQTDAARLVDEMYWGLLGRKADAGGAEYYTNLFLQGNFKEAFTEMGNAPELKQRLGTVVQEASNVTPPTDDQVKGGKLLEAVKEAIQ